MVILRSLPAAPHASVSIATREHCPFASTAPLISLFEAPVTLQPVTIAVYNREICGEYVNSMLPMGKEQVVRGNM